MPESQGVRGWSQRRAGLVAAAVPGLLMLAAGSWGLGRNSLFGSEADTYWAARLPLSQLFHLLGNLDAVHGTYYLLMHGWFTFGSSFAWLRVPSLIGMVAAASLLSLIATRLTGRARIGLAAGVVFAFTPSIATWAQNGRSYGLVAAAVAATTLALVRAVHVDVTQAGTSRRPWVVFGALTILTGYLHEFTLLLVASFGLTLLWVGVPRRVLRRWFVSTAVAVAAVLPLLLLSATESSAVSHLRPPRLASLQPLFEQLFGTNIVIAVLLAAFAVVGAWPLRRARRSGQLSAAALGVPMLLVPAALLLVESRVGHPFYDLRYVLYSTLAAALLAACGIERVGRALVAAARRGRPVLAHRLVLAWAVLICLSVALVQWPTQRYLRTAASRGEDYGAAARYVAQHHETGDAVVFMAAGARNAQLGFPAQFAGLRDVASAVPPARAGTFRGINLPAAAAIAAVRASDQIIVLGAYPFRADPKGLAGMGSVLAHEFAVLHVARFAGVSVISLDRIARFEHGKHKDT